ncbi:transposase [Gelidibacter pelagius]|uniref:Transposase n=1 Tax=Gelidibacter pelagius TaxID=2819985 RepID=A0ABS3SPW0_9FLAO|nr:transposase [Gelidibacter pelagius]MBO3097734.1 transposase [Gelidibacter pelagius]
MADKFQNKHRIPSARLQTWDYRWQGAYFITICTKNRAHYFGEVLKNKMELTNIGVLADVFWHEIKNHSKNITLGEFIVMPNHVHGILIINAGPIEETRHALSLRDSNENRDSNEIPHAKNIGNPNPEKSIGQNRFRNPGKNSISSIIGGYKSAVTKHANRLNLEFGWQTRFYDHIIRNERAFNTISNYIKNNPKKWGEDKFRS